MSKIVVKMFCRKPKIENLATYMSEFKYIFLESLWFKIYSKINFKTNYVRIFKFSRALNYFELYSTFETFCFLVSNKCLTLTN